MKSVRVIVRLFFSRDRWRVFRISSLLSSFDIDFSKNRMLVISNANQRFIISIFSNTDYYNIKKKISNNNSFLYFFLILNGICEI